MTEANSLAGLSISQLDALRLFHCVEGRAAQSAGDKDEAYRHAMIVRRVVGEMRVRQMVAA